MKAEPEIQEVSDVNTEVHIHHTLNFNLHIDKICQSASNQLNALTRYLGKNEKKGLDDSLIYSNFI